MLSFIISTIAFFLAAYALNRYFNAHELDSTRSLNILVMVVATFISLGAGWLIDKLDGDAALPQKNVSITEVIQGGDPVKIAKGWLGLTSRLTWWGMTYVLKLSHKFRGFFHPDG